LVSHGLFILNNKLITSTNVGKFSTLSAANNHDKQNI